MWSETRPYHAMQRWDDVDGLWGRGGASITVPCLILSSTTGLGGNPRVTAHAKLRARAARGAPTLPGWLPR